MLQCKNKSVVYGEESVDLTYTLSEDIYRDQLALSVTRTSGDLVGVYPITAKTTNPNFALTVIPANYTITQRTLEVVGQVGTIYIYNGNNPNIRNIELDNIVSGDECFSIYYRHTKNAGTRSSLAITLNGPRY